MEKLYLWLINRRMTVNFFEITELSFKKELEGYQIIDKLNNKAISLSETSPEEIFNILINCPSTNGLYSVPGSYKSTVSIWWEVPETNDVRLLISTQSFLEKYLNDININTTMADGKYFFKGKNISPKLFLKKHLLRLREPSRFNDVDPSHEKIEDILYKEFESMSIIELKDILRSYGVVLSGNKHQLILKLTTIVQNNV